MVKFNYKNEIVPIAQLLCESDQGRSEFNFGQMLEALKDIAYAVKKDKTILEAIQRYADNLKD